MEKLTEEQIKFVLGAVGKWLKIRMDGTTPGVPVYTPSVADVDHSALLYRLLSGKEAFAKAPPRAFSYPDYDLAEGNVVNVIDEPFQFPHQFTAQGGVGTIDEFTVSINQHMGYKWVDKDKGILEHKNGDFFKYTPNSPNTPLLAGTLQKIQEPHETNQNDPGPGQPA